MWRELKGREQTGFPQNVGIGGEKKDENRSKDNVIM